LYFSQSARSRVKFSENIYLRRVPQVKESKTEYLRADNSPLIEFN